MKNKAFNSRETDVVQILPNINNDKPTNRTTSSDTHRKLANYQYIPLYIYVRFPPKPLVFTIKNLSLWTKDRTTANN